MIAKAKFTKSKESTLSRWNQMVQKPVLQKRQLMIFTIGLLVSTVLLILCVIKMSLNTNLHVWVIEVDKAGKALAVGQAQKTVVTNDNVVRAHVYQFIELARGIVTDPEAMRTHLTKVYAMSTPAVKNYLNQHYQDSNPMTLASQESRQVILNSFLKQSAMSYIVEWTEIKRDLNNDVLNESEYKAFVTIVQNAPKTQEEMQANVENPFGIYIENLSWSKVQ